MAVMHKRLTAAELGLLEKEQSAHRDFFAERALATIITPPVFIVLYLPVLFLTACHFLAWRAFHYCLILSGRRGFYDVAGGWSPTRNGCDKVEWAQRSRHYSRLHR